MNRPTDTGTPSGAAVHIAIRRILEIGGLLLLLVASTTPLLAVADLAGAERGTVAAVFPPGTARPAALAAVIEAGGLLVGEGAWGNVLVAHGDETGFAGRLRHAGAWLVLDPKSAAGCLIVGSTTNKR